MNEESRSTLAQWREKVDVELERVLNFWLEHSHDDVHGGFFTCLDENGTVFDETKYIWLQARQVWMYCRLYNEVPKFSNDNILQTATKGAKFLMDNCLIKRDGHTRCAFSTTRDGKPNKIQKSLFSECFYTMAMSEIWRATKQQRYKDAAVEMMKQIQHWCIEDDRDLGKDTLPGCMPTSSLSVAMMALCLCEQMATCNIGWQDDESTGTDLQTWAVQELLIHRQRDGTKILENVTTEGKEIPGSNGRLQNPGHAIECGWMLLQHAMKIGDDALAKESISAFIDEPFKQGWDNKYGGLLYFIDADGFPPIQLEWNMKLWWQHNEAMIAFLMSFQYTNDEGYIKIFEKVAQYTFSKFIDPNGGGWFGYLNQRGEISSSFKGGAWKGFFHIPRSLYLCSKLLSQILENKK